MNYDLLTFGVPMIEIVRPERDCPFSETASFLGPFPSNDTCIVTDVAARLGLSCCYLGPFGDDTFAPSVIRRLESHGVDMSRITQIPGCPSYLVFVRYNSDGKREYLTFPSQKLLDHIHPDMIDPEIVKRSRWVHFSGEIIQLCGTSGPKRETILKLLHCISPDTMVSVDPNFDRSNPDTDEMMAPFLSRANVLLPSEGEARNLFHTETDDIACRQLASEGKIIVLKRGKQGCRIYNGSDTIDVEAFTVAETDPTGCGDSFCAGFITGMIQGKSLADAARYGNAAGALQATAIGPMEGPITPETVSSLLLSARKQK